MVRDVASMKAFSPKHIALSLAYDEFYRRAQVIIDKYNPCKITDGKCLNGTPCCGGCEHLSNKGCTVSSLRCKVWLCHVARDAFPECAKELRQIEDKIYKIHPGLFWARHSKAQLFDNMTYPESSCFEEDTPPEIGDN